MLDFEYDQNGANTYLCGDVPARTQLDQRTLNAQQVNAVPGLAKLSVVDHFGDVQLRYQVTSRIPLALYLNGAITEEQLSSLLASITDTLQGLGRYQVHAKFVLLDCDRIFVNVSDVTCEMICLPVSDAEEPSFEEFLRVMLSKTSIQAGSSYNLYGQLMQLLNETDVTVSDVAALLQPAGKKPGPAVPLVQAPAEPPLVVHPLVVPPAVVHPPVIQQPVVQPVVPPPVVPPPVAQPPAAQPAAPSQPVAPPPQPGAAGGFQVPGAAPRSMAIPGMAIPGAVPAAQSRPGVSAAQPQPQVAAVPVFDEPKVSAIKGIFGSKKDTEAWHRQMAAKKAAKAGGAVVPPVVPAAPGMPAVPAGQPAPAAVPVFDEPKVSAIKGIFGSKKDTEAWHRQMAAKKAAKAAGVAPAPVVPPAPAPAPAPLPVQPAWVPPAAPGQPAPQPAPGVPQPAPAAPPPYAGQPAALGTVVFGQQQQGGVAAAAAVPKGTTIIGNAAAAASPSVPLSANVHTITLRRTGRQAILNRPEFKLGRNPDYADFAVEDNSNVSSAHAVITQSGGRFWIMDTNSTNHVTVAGQRIPPNVPVELPVGTTFALGDEEFILN